MVLKLHIALAALLVASVAAQTNTDEHNIGFPVAEPTIPFDKCSVSAANDASMRLTAVAWGYNNEFWVSKQSENWGPWGSWESIGGFFVGGPTVIRNANNDIVVFGVDASRQLNYQVFSSNPEAAALFNGWIRLGGKLSGRPAVLVDAQGLIHVFARGKDSAVWEIRQFANGTEAVWGEWTSIGGIITSEPAAIADAESIIHLFARGVDGALWTITQKLEDDGSLTWVSWIKMENSVVLSSSAHIVASLNAQNLVEVVVRAADKQLWHTRQTVNDDRGVIWSPWKSLEGTLASAGSIKLNYDSLLAVFGVGPERGIWYKQQAHHPVDSASDAWSKWVPIGGRFTAGADVVSDSRGYMNVFGRGLDRSIWVRSQLVSNHTVGFFSPWANLGGRFRSFAC